MVAKAISPAPSYWTAPECLPRWQEPEAGKRLITVALLWLRILLVVCMFPAALQASPVQVAVASNFSAPMKQIAAHFERDTGFKTSLVFGSTGQFYAQIRNGAPFELLLAADAQTPGKLQQEGLAIRGTGFTYAIGRLVLWSKKTDLVDQGGAVLRSDRYRNIAIANPKLAPYGAAAIQTLERLGLREQVTKKMVEASNITQCFQFVDSENVELGFVALSQVIENGQIRTGSAWVIPAHFHEPIEQVAILLRPGQTSRPAQALLQYMQSEKARRVIESFGYESR